MKERQHLLTRERRLSRAGNCQRPLDKERVRAAAQGKWLHIFSAQGIQFDESIKRGKHGPCPVCGGKDRFRFFDLQSDGRFICSGNGDQHAGDGFKLLMECNGRTFPQVLRDVAISVGLTSQESSIATKPQSAKPALSATTEAKGRDPARTLQRILQDAQPISVEGEVFRYLESRGLAALASDLPQDLFEHPRLRYYEGGEPVGEYSAMIAVMRDAKGEMANLHRTYIADGSKAPVSSPRKACKPVTATATRGAAIKLYEPDHRLCIAEGIESALAVRLLTGWPVWSGIQANLFAQVEVPGSVSEVWIWADGEPAGTGAAVRLRDKLIAAGKQVRITLPPDQKDPLDVYEAIQSGQSLDDLITTVGIEAQPGRQRLTGRRCQCSACGEYFNSEKAFDQHRSGPYTGVRRCMSTAEMKARGMRVSNGWWLTSG